MLLEAMANRLAELKNCAAANCREIEDLPVEPASLPVVEFEPPAKG